MKYYLTAFLAIGLFANTISYAEQQKTTTPNNNQSQIIANIDSQPAVQGSEQYFTGVVKINPMFSLDNPSRTAAYVTFEAGARSAWHTHPKGQLLVVTAGTGLTQEWGGTIHQIKHGDVIWCPPNIKHWHGASPNSAMTHISLVEELNGKNVNWLEKVTDEQYSQHNH